MREVNLMEEDYVGHVREEARRDHDRHVIDDAIPDGAYGCVAYRVEEPKGAKLVAVAPNLAELSALVYGLGAETAGIRCMQVDKTHNQAPTQFVTGQVFAGQDVVYRQ